MLTKIHFTISYYMNELIYIQMSMYEIYINITYDSCHF